MNFNSPILLRSNLERYRFQKYFFGPMVFLLLGPLCSGPFHAWSLAMIIPVVLTGVFILTIAEVRATDELLYYRRFLTWKQISYHEVRDCRVAWFPATGRLRLQRPVAPWSAIYFALLGPRYGLRAWVGGQTEFTAWVNAKRQDQQVEPHSEVEQRCNIRRSHTACAMSAVIGTLYSFFYYSLVPESPLTWPWPGFPTGIRLLFAFEKLAFGFPWGFITCGVLAAAVVLMRFERKAWFTAFILGALLTSVIIQGLELKYG